MISMGCFMNASGKMKKSDLYGDHNKNVNNINNLSD